MLEKHQPLRLEEISSPRLGYEPKVSCISWPKYWSRGIQSLWWCISAWFFDRKLFARWAMTWVIEQTIKTSKEDFYYIHSAGQCQWRASKISVLVRNSCARLWLRVPSEHPTFRSCFPTSQDELPCDKYLHLPKLFFRLVLSLNFMPRQETCLFFLSIEDKHQGTEQSFKILKSDHLILLLQTFKASQCS